MWFTRLARAAISLSIVLVAYWAYAVVAVPWVEPSPRRRDDEQASGGAPATRRRTTDRYRRQLEALFPAGSWQLEQAKILYSPGALLLLKDYRTREDGSIELKPCTAVFYPSGGYLDKNGHPAPAVVLHAPEGAILEFDPPLDLRRAEFGRLVGGRLVGQITIQGRGLRTGDGHDLEIVTRNVQLNAERVWTPHEVHFRLGRSFGSGRDMIITLRPDPQRREGRAGSLAVAGIKSFELVHIDRFHLQTDLPALVPQNARPRPPAAPAADAPLEIACKGPFQLDMTDLVATFEDDVDVVRLNPNGPSDQLACQLLALHLDRPPPRAAAGGAPDAKAPPRGSAALSGLRLRRLVASGFPLVLRSPATELTVRGERLEYDLVQRRLRLESQGRILVEHGPRQIETPRLQYELASTGRVGRFWAAGPGWLRVRPTAPGSQGVEARWQDQVRLQPNGDGHLLSVEQGGYVRVDASGEIAAEAIHCWFHEQPRTDEAAQGTPRYRLVPDRLLARDQVQFDSRQLSGATTRLEMWFRPAPGTPPEKDPTGVAGGGRQEPRGLASSGASKLDVRGELLQVLLTQDGSRVELRDLTIRGAARVRELLPGDAREEPLELAGELLEIRGAGRASGELRVEGAPASIRARGMVALADRIQLDRAQNRLWIDVPGTVQLPAAQIARDQAVAPDAVMALSWQRGMQFDGRTIRLESDVQGRAPGQWFRADRLDVTLNRGLDFSQPGQDLSQVQVRQIATLGNVEFQQRTTDERGLVSEDRMQIDNLVVDQQTGELRADGAGWVTTVRRGSLGDDAGPQGASGRGGTSPSSAASDGPWTYLRVDFRQGLTGNVLRREVQFHQHVQAAYGPVASPQERVDPDSRAGLGERAVLLHCDRLGVAEVDGPAEGRRTIELEAVGNTLVEGRTFTARAHRISYAQAKDLLVMEGSGRADAELWRQAQPGGAASRAAAGRILYWPSTKRLEVDDARYLDLSDLGGLAPEAKP